MTNTLRTQKQTGKRTKNSIEKWAKKKKKDNLARKAITFLKIRNDSFLI